MGLFCIFSVPLIPPINAPKNILKNDKMKMSSNRIIELKTL